jgi:hypothetical protein
MYTLEKHIDGKWFTSNHSYKDRKLQVKMRSGHGAKIHIWNVEGTKVEKTFKYHFSELNFLLNKAKTWIDGRE